jgi:hypothetical protein
MAEVRVEEEEVGVVAERADDVQGGPTCTGR